MINFELQRLVSTFPEAQRIPYGLALAPWITSRTEWHKVKISSQCLKTPTNISQEAAKPTPSPEV
jgi:hypothetical protein